MRVPPPPPSFDRTAATHLRRVYVPRYATWDLAFHCVPLCMVDPEWAKRQLILMLREWYMHPSGQIPAYVGGVAWLASPLPPRPECNACRHNIVGEYCAVWWVSAMSGTTTMSTRLCMRGQPCECTRSPRSAYAPDSGPMPRSSGARALALNCPWMHAGHKVARM